jgi:hypothetical protein
MRCYSTIFEVLEDLESFGVDGDSNPSLKRIHAQTYELVYGSDDELFHQALYEWYVSRGQQERLLEAWDPVFPSLTLDTNTIYSRIPRTSSHCLSISSQSTMAVSC